MGQKHNLVSSTVIVIVWLAYGGTDPGPSYRICLDKKQPSLSQILVFIQPRTLPLTLPWDSCSRLGKDKTTLRPNYSQLHQLLKRISRKQLCQQPAAAWRLLLPFQRILTKPTGFSHGSISPALSMAEQQISYSAPVQLQIALFTSWLTLKITIGQTWIS